MRDIVTDKCSTGGARGWHCESLDDDDGATRSWFVTSSYSSHACHTPRFVIASSSCIAVKPELQVKRLLAGNVAL